jgi:MFS family permease
VKPGKATSGTVRSERAVLVTAALGTMLMPLNSTMIAVALPDIVDDLDVSIASTAWLVSGYLIAQASLQRALDAARVRAAGSRLSSGHRGGGHQRIPHLSVARYGVPVKPPNSG